MIEGKRVAILAEEGFEDAELIETLRAIKDAGARVVIVGTGLQKTCKGKRGRATVTVDVTADEVNALDFDALIVSGGSAPDRLRLHQPVIDLMRRACEAGKIIAAICQGPRLLISADIVKGRRVTSWPPMAIDLKSAGAIWIDEPVVQDRNIITSRKPADLPRFNKLIIETLARQE